MDALLSGLIAIGLLLVLILVIYLVDRVNALERKTAVGAAAQGQDAARTEAASGPFGGLAGKALWDVVSGGESSGADPTEVAMIRQRYEPILAWHIEAIFEDGRTDGRAGKTTPPKNPRRMNTLRGVVDCWLPEVAVTTIYQCGQDHVRKGPANWAEVRRVLDETCSNLFARCEIPMAGKLSERLMGPDPDAPPEPAAEQNSARAAAETVPGVQPAAAGPKLDRPAGA